MEARLTADALSQASACAPHPPRRSRRSVGRTLVLAAALAIVTIPQAAVAQWANNGFPIAPLVNPASQRFSVSIPDISGGAIIVWVDARTSEETSDIYAQRLSATGVPLWTSGGVPICTAAGKQWEPRVVSDGSDGALIVWSDHRGADPDIYAQRVSGTGVTLWTPNGVSVASVAGHQGEPEIVSFATGNSYITWHDGRDGSRDIYAQRLNTNGARLWTPNGIAVCDADGEQRSPAITRGAVGDAIIAWQDKRRGDFDVFAARIDASGDLLWTDNGVSLIDTLLSQTNVRIVPDGADGAIVAWEDDRDDRRNAKRNDLYAQRLDPSGALLWSEDGMPITTAPGDQSMEQMIADGAGGAIIAWQDGRAGFFFDIYAQRLDANGLQVWATDGAAVCTAPGFQQGVQLTTDGNGGAVFVWQDRRCTTNSDIYAQHFTAAGDLGFTVNGIPVCSADGFQGRPSVAAAPGAVIVSWTDHRNAAELVPNSTVEIYSHLLGISATVDDVALLEGDTGTLDFVFNVSIPMIEPGDIVIDYATLDGTATVADNDYVPASGSLTIPAGQLTGTITVQGNGDLTPEDDETFKLELTSPANPAVRVGLGIGTIRDDDGAPRVSINNLSINEGNVGDTPFSFEVSLSRAIDQQVTVDYTTADGSATLANGDYDAASGTLTIPAFIESVLLTVNANGDATIENAETFRVLLDAPVNAVFGDSLGEGTIINDDGVPSVSISDAVGPEGDIGTSFMTFLVQLSHPSDQDITMRYSTGNGTALVSDNDYLAMAGSITIPAKTQSTQIQVIIIGDTNVEQHEYFFVNLSELRGAFFEDAQGEGTILTDDGATVPGFAVNDISLEEGDAGTSNLNFTVGLTFLPIDTVSVDYATEDGSATLADNDYQPVSGTLTFLPASGVQTVSVPIVGDTTPETFENFFLRLSNPNGANLADSVGIGIIANDDAIFTIDDVSHGEGDFGSTEYVFTVDLTGGTDGPVTIDFETGDLSATSFSGDYRDTSGVVSFPPQVISGQRTISVFVFGDLVLEPTELFAVNLSNQSFGAILDGQGRGEILDDDGPPTFSVGDVSKPEGLFGTVPFEFEVTLSSLAEQEITLDFVTSDGSATIADNDYAAASGTITIPPLAASVFIPVQVNGDATVEPSETFFLDISNPSLGAVADGQGQGTIVDDDATPPSVSLHQPNGGEVLVVGAPTKISWNASPGERPLASFDVCISRDNGANYQVIATGIPPTDDFFIWNVTGPPTYPLFTALVQIKAFDTEMSSSFDVSDAPFAIFDISQSLAIQDVSRLEGDAGTTAFQFVVTLANTLTQDVTVDYVTQDGTATVADIDYLPVNGTLTIPAGSSLGSVIVQVVGDETFEGDETFSVVLSNPSTGSLADNVGIGTIIGDDDVATPALLLRFEPLALSDGIEVRWQFNDPNQFSSVTLERSPLRGGPWVVPDVDTRDEHGVAVALDRDVAPSRTYFYRLVGRSELRDPEIFGPIEVTTQAGLEFAISAIGPNPMREETRIEFAVARKADVDLRIFDVHGREVAVLSRGPHRPGRYQVRWNGRGVNGSVRAGMYFVRYRAAGNDLVQRLVILK